MSNNTFNPLSVFQIKGRDWTSRRFDQLLNVPEELKEKVSFCPKGST